MAEELRNNIEALRMLEQEHGQVGHCCSCLTNAWLCDNWHHLSFALRRLSHSEHSVEFSASDKQVLVHLSEVSCPLCIPDMWLGTALCYRGFHSGTAVESRQLCTYRHFRASV